MAHRSKTQKTSGVVRAASLSLGAALALVMASCSVQPGTPVSPTGASGGTASIVTASPSPTASPTPTPTPSPSPGTGRFTGGGRLIDVGVARVTNGLTIHCDLKLSNNLEINWGVGQNFHMTEHLTAVCTDDPAIEQKPPVAPLDTLVGTGTGKFNNVPGYSISFTLVDAGEPGRDDMFGFRITAPGGAVVLDVPPTKLAGGNLQAHYDQPHGQRP